MTGSPACVVEKQLAVEALDTSLFVETVNNMWDLVNSNTIKDPLSKTAIKKKDFDVQEQSFEKFQSFIESYQFLNNKRKPATLPCHRGWLITLRALKQLCETLIRDEKLVHFWCLRKFNQDHVENMHSRISAFHGFNDHPMRHQYVTAIKCLSCSLGTTELID